jgi:arginase
LTSCLFAVPYHLGRKDIGVGRGPRHMLVGAAESHCEVHPDELPENQIDAIVAVNSALAAAIRRSADDLPVVVSGDCNSCLGTLTGLGLRDIGIIWFDAHGDLNTPETSPSGFFDGMSTSIALGDCHSGVWSRLGATNCIAAANVLLVATRDLDPLERPRIEDLAVQMAEAQAIRARGVPAELGPKLDALAELVTEIYLHFDIDALDPEFAPGAGYRCPDGISLAEARQAIRMIGERFRIRAAAFTNYNPEYEVDGKTLSAGRALFRAIAAAASSPARNLRPASS